MIEMNTQRVVVGTHVIPTACLTYCLKHKVIRSLDIQWILNNKNNEVGNRGVSSNCRLDAQKALLKMAKPLRGN